MGDIINSEEGYYVLAKPGGDITVLDLNQEINIFGSCINLVGTSFDIYFPIRDEPVRKEIEKKKEKKKGSWWGNLIGGVIATVVATAAVAVAAVVLPGVVTAFGICAIAGTAIGGGIATAAMSYTDAKNGEARSLGDFLEGVFKGIAIGGTTAACSYLLWSTIPAVSQAAGLQAAMLTGGPSLLTTTVIPAITTVGGYGLVGTNAAFAVNDIVTIGTGQDWMLKNIFGGNKDAYDTARILTGTLSMAYTQLGFTNAALDGRTAQRVGLQFGKLGGGASCTRGLVKDGLGKISGNTYEVTQEGIDAVKRHISNNNFDAYENTEMIKRLENALREGEKITGADASYYLHELKEAELMSSGMTYEAAHRASLDFYEVSNFSVYHPDVISMNPEEWSKAWFDFWGISK